MEYEERYAVMALLREEDRQKIRQQFDRSLIQPVKLAFFTQNLDCLYCGPTELLLKEVAPLSSRISLEIYNFINDRPQVEQYGIDKIPAIAVVGQKDYGIRFYGIPSGFEFTSLIEAIVDVSRGQSELSDESKQILRTLNRPVAIQVFVTPTCPYCQSMVRLAHQAAVESELVMAAMVEATEFPHLVQRYGIRGVPRTVFNDSLSLDGAVPEHIFIQHLKEAGK